MSKGYHRGDLIYARKAETLGQLNVGRSTGFFGTGFYFTEDFKLSRENRNRDLWEIDIDKYNLLQGSVPLHEWLKSLNAYVSWWPLMKIDTEKWSRLIYAYERLDSFENWFGNFNYIRTHPEEYDSYEDQFEDELDEYLKEINNFQKVCRETGFKEVFKPLFDELLYDEPSGEVFKEFDKNDYLDRDALEKVREKKSDTENDYLSVGMDYINSFAEQFYSEFSEYYEDGYFISRNVPNKYSLDSIPTRFLKSLGYEGVKPDRSTNNSAYGGVVYDLKEGTYRVMVGESFRR